ncbi:hypothetical protein PGT21_031833 [Puccinia graminis f. sp. tritici]|uniref:Myb-like domain-containing protein n=1 Tax=Puccinia graminis f. sp. tritici TaxID=56615 RepID=A0A5B0PE70_PUCGR|nr:hypothetical protein PGTUg99_009734 [Puccinia graminis f. sp. tritici]KAA1104788.1 hypothetical protein PGT21_031833 [Puccinia graminis f. sp. tritici]
MAGGRSQVIRPESPEIEVVSSKKKTVEKRKHSPTPAQPAKPPKAAKTTKAQPKPTYQWSASEDADLISVLEEIQINQSGPMNVFSNSAWTEAAEKLNAYNTDHSKDKDAAACKTRFNELKKMYRTFKRLKNMSGGGWDERNKRVIFDREWWDDWAQDGSQKAEDMLVFRYKGFPLFEDMFHLVEKDRTAGW